MRFAILSGLFLLFCGFAQADSIKVKVVQAVELPNAKIAIGSEVRLASVGSAADTQAIFLGKSLSPSGEVVSYLFLQENDDRVHYYPAATVAQTEEGWQQILNPYQQQGGTCAAYAIDDFLQQTNLSGLEGNGALARTLSTEQGRTSLLADAINRYYLVAQHQNSLKGILNSYGRQFGFSCDRKKFDDTSLAKDFMLEQLQNGLPVLISFNVGPDMVGGPFPLVNEANNKKMDIRLWIPRKKGERNSGGHVVVAAASFMYQNRLMMMMIDSDWDSPRIWDFEKFFDKKTANSEIEYVTCNE